jgi:acetylornithine deacetylase/succinyl-diaminopimelate desuccinylase-like protein
MRNSRKIACSVRMAVLAAMFACALTPIEAGPSGSTTNVAEQQLARDIYRELVEINTSQSAGDTYKAAQAMAARLKAAGFTDNEVQTFETGPKRGNLVARLRGTGKRKPILLLAHIDVVEALRADWSTDPYKFVEQDGYFYGRGTSDDKFMAAAFVANFIRYRKEGYKPDRDLILALTTDEEISDQHEYGIRGLLKDHRELIDAEFALNEGGGVTLENGKPRWISLETTEKRFQNFWLEVTNKGGHSSVPSKDNAIYQLAAGLNRLAAFDFPVHLNETTRAYLAGMGDLTSGQDGRDMKALAANPADTAAAARLSTRPAYNAQLRTTCVATRLAGGHADNALPQLARAMVNCRILPGEAVDSVRGALVRALGDERISVKPDALDTASDPAPLSPELEAAIRTVARKFWPGAPLLVVMSTGASDGRFLSNAGIPSYGQSGLASDIFENRNHGKDERVAVQAFRDGLEYQYQLVKELAAGR